jgi:hypothetical protein
MVALRAPGHLDNLKIGDFLKRLKEEEVAVL